VRKISEKKDKLNVPPSCDTSGSKIRSSLERAIFGSFDDLSELAFHMDLENPSYNNVDTELPRSKVCCVDVASIADTSCQCIQAATANSNSDDPTKPPSRTGFISAHPEEDKVVLRI
jgi:hypothetical protein